MPSPEPDAQRQTSPGRSWFAAGITLFGYALSGSVALAGFGLDSLIEIGASTVVLWELSGSGRSGSDGRCGCRSGLRSGHSPRTALIRTTGSASGRLGTWWPPAGEHSSAQDFESFRKSVPLPVTRES